MRFLARAVAIGLLASRALAAQEVVVTSGGERNSGAFIREAMSQRHVVFTGAGKLELPRDSTVTSTVLVIGRDAYVASKVQGNVVVVGGNLFLRPGVDISGHAVAIGGTVTNTTLGHVGGRIESYRDDLYDVTPTATGYALAYRPVVDPRVIPLVRLSGIYGVLIPTYDRVDGLSLPVGVLATLAGGAIEVEPTVTYRSRLGDFDPQVAVRIRPDQPVRFEGRVGRDTRTNDKWIYGDLLNSALSFFAGSDIRNYFRSDVAEGRVFALTTSASRSIEPFVGARYEKVSGITAAGNVYSVLGRHDDDRMARPNPFVASGNIGSVLAGAEMFDTSGVVTSRLRAEMEQSFTTVTGTSNFFQVTLDGKIGFPTFGTQRLAIHAHAVATPAKNVSAARYAYVGGSGSMPNLDNLQIGGDELLFVDSRYTIPLDMITLPIPVTPTVTLRDILGSAGVDGLPALHHAIGIGLGVSVLRMDYTRDVTGRGAHKNKFSFGVSLF